MVSTTTRSVLGRTRARFRDRPQRDDAESGSLILDILIGMAIFALIAIIAISGIGQYRMRAYTQSAVSDAEATALAVQATIIDNASSEGAYPTGVLTAAQLEAMEVTPTGRGANISVITVTPNPSDAEAFEVCVRHRGAFAVYDSEVGLISSGDAAKKNFAGCGTTTPDPDPDPDPDPTAVATPTNVNVDVTNDEATVTWTAVPGATAYLVHLDGATDPAWTGATPTATLPGLSVGDHTVTVTAATGGTSSTPTAPVSFEVTGPSAPAAIAMLRTEVYEGALDGDDRNPANPSSDDVWFGDGYTRYPNAMGQQASGNYQPGPAALADNDPDTAIRVSSAWAADWAAVLDGSSLVDAESITVTADITATYINPAASNQYVDLDMSLNDYDGSLNGYWFASAESSYRLTPGQTRTITWTIDDAFLNGTQTGADYRDSMSWADNGATTFADFRDRLLAEENSLVNLYLSKGNGGNPYEIDVSRLTITGN